MANSIGFASLPREIRDQIYKEVLVSSEPILMIHRIFPIGKVREKGLELLDPAYSNQQIAQEACEAYYGYNTFWSLSVMLPVYLESRVDLTGGRWFSPAAWIRKILATVLVIRGQIENIAARFKMLCKCMNLRRVTIKAYAIHNLGQPALIARITGIIYLGRKLKQELGVEPEIYVHAFGYLKLRTLNPYIPRLPLKLMDETENVSWLLDTPDAEVCRKVWNGEGSDREWLVVRMATFWAPLLTGIWPD